MRVGIEAAGHYHRPLLTPSSWPPGWELLELNPAHVTEQRRVQGRRRVKTDVIDLEAITELLLAGRGAPVGTRDELIGELTAWSAHRTRRVAIRTATKNQLLGQLDRSFPGLTLALPDVLGTKVGRLVAGHFADPARLAGLGQPRFIRFAATPRPAGPPARGRTAGRRRRGTRCRTADAAVARQVLATDLALLVDLDAQIGRRRGGDGRAAARQLRSPPCCHGPGLGPGPGRATTPPRSVTHTRWPGPGSSTAPPG